MSDEIQGPPDLPPSSDSANETPPDPPGASAGSAGPPPPPPGTGSSAGAPPPPGGGAPPPPAGGNPGFSGGGPSAGGSSENRTLWLVLAYLGPLALIPFFIEKDDAEVQWHTKNGLLFTVANILVSIVANMVFSMLACFGCLPAIVLAVIQIGIHVAGIYKALKGEQFRIPGLSEIADRPWG